MAGLIGGIALSCCPGDERGHDIRGMSVETGAGAVVSRGGARVGVGGSFLHIPQRHPGVERRGYECMPSLRTRRVQRICVAIRLGPF
jgi:hypothetical protein